MIDMRSEQIHPSGCANDKHAVAITTFEIILRFIYEFSIPLSRFRCISGGFIPVSGNGFEEWSRRLGKGLLPAAMRGYLCHGEFVH
jgi:hypothetical protein